MHAARAHLGADLGQVDEHHVTERVLGVVGDAHADDCALAFAHSWSLEYRRSLGISMGQTYKI